MSGWCVCSRCQSSEKSTLIHFFVARCSHCVHKHSRPVSSLKSIFWPTNYFHEKEKPIRFVEAFHTHTYNITYTILFNIFSSVYQQGILIFYKGKNKIPAIHPSIHRSVCPSFRYSAHLSLHRSLRSSSRLTFPSGFHATGPTRDTAESSSAGIRPIWRAAASAGP